MTIVHAERSRRDLRSRSGRIRPPSRPTTIAETGLGLDFLADLLLKFLHVRGAMLGSVLAREAGLAYRVLDPVVTHLRRNFWVEVRSAQGGGPAGYELGLSESGRARAREALEHSAYVGTAPVTLDQLTRQAREQSIHRVRVPRERIEGALSDLTLSAETLERLGPAVNSGRSCFLYGPPGNGKTAVAARLSAVLGDSVFIPRAVYVDGHVMTVYDAAEHQRWVEPTAADGAEAPDPGSGEGGEEPEYDGRYVRTRRPVIITSGELRLDELDLRFDPVSRVYRAPVQLKAMGGALVLDDFGRQRESPSALLSRWILPLEYEVDYLTLHTGFKFQIPFDCLLVFATNLDPDSLVDEAFLRRIQYKIEFDDPDREEYARILRQEGESHRLEVDDGWVDWIFDQYYEPRGIEPRACHPRDLLKLVRDRARYRGEAPRVARDSMRFACDTYFLSGEAARSGGADA